MSMTSESENNILSSEQKEIFKEMFFFFVFFTSAHESKSNMFIVYIHCIDFVIRSAHIGLYGNRDCMYKQTRIFF